MSRTDAHVPYKYLPGGREYHDWWPAHLIWQHRGSGPKWQHEWNKQFGRERAVREYARQMNRNERHEARAALRRGDYDTLSTRYSGRHGGVWLAW